MTTQKVNNDPWKKDSTEKTERTQSLAWDDMSLSSNSEMEKKKVAFSSITIREYPICVGDNCPITGVPITIDWCHVSEINCSMEDYESQKLKPRSFLELRIPSLARRDMLKRLGFSLQDMRKGQKAANITKRNRKRTRETMHLSNVQEMIEKVIRASFNATIGLGKKKKEKDFLSYFPTYKDSL